MSSLLKQAASTCAGAGDAGRAGPLRRQFADPQRRESWIRDKNMVVFQMHSDQHAETRIDLFIAEPFDFDAEYERALTGEILPGLQTRFVCLEALLHMKETADIRRGAAPTLEERLRVA